VRKGDSRYSASVSWQHGRNGDSLLLSGPLGQGLAELVRDGNGARLTLSDHRQYAADSLDELSAKVFGFPLPLSGMAHWVVGSAPQGTVEGRDAQGRPQRLAADGWAIDLLAWETDSGDALPNLVELRRDDLEVRLKILDWQDVR
jgi:outer membrane lipoprotein LolB